jgi:predicted tellurium resistance membrane protein TerC
MAGPVHSSTCPMRHDHAQLDGAVAVHAASPVQELFLLGQREVHGTVIVVVAAASSLVLMFLMAHSLANLLDKVPIRF